MVFLEPFLANLSIGDYTSTYSKSGTELILLGEKRFQIHREGVYLLGFSPLKTFAMAFVWAGIPLLRIPSTNTRCFIQVFRAAGCA